MSYEPFCRCGNPHQVKKLTTRWPDCRHDINYSSENWPQKKKKKKKKRKQVNPGTEDYLYFKQSRWCWSGHWWPIPRWLSRAEYAVPICSPLIVGGGSPPLDWSLSSPYPWLPASKIKHIFWLFEQQAARPYFPLHSEDFKIDLTLLIPCWSLWLTRGVFIVQTSRMRGSH